MTVVDVFETAAGETIEVPVARFVEQLESPRDTKEWKVTRQDGIETFTAPDNAQYVRANPNEEAHVIVTFTRTGMTPLRLVRYDASTTIRRAERKARRQRRELQQRGYDV